MKKLALLFLGVLFSSLAFSQVKLGDTKWQSLAHQADHPVRDELSDEQIAKARVMMAKDYFHTDETIWVWNSIDGNRAQLIELQPNDIVSVLTVKKIDYLYGPGCVNRYTYEPKPVERNVNVNGEKVATVGNGDVNINIDIDNSNVINGCCGDSSKVAPVKPPVEKKDSIAQDSTKKVVGGLTIAPCFFAGFQQNWGAKVDAGLVATYISPFGLRAYAGFGLGLTKPKYFLTDAEEECECIEDGKKPLKLKTGIVMPFFQTARVAGEVALVDPHAIFGQKGGSFEVRVSYGGEGTKKAFPEVFLGLGYKLFPTHYGPAGFYAFFGALYHLRLMPREMTGKELARFRSIK